jgi:hypothetical protein
MNWKGACAIVVCFVELTVHLCGETGEDADTLVMIVENAIEIGTPYVLNINLEDFLSASLLRPLLFEHSFLITQVVS